jgi:membrane-associated protein
MFGQFTHLVADASGWAYAVLVVFALFDALLPVVPSEASVITAGVVAAGGNLSLPLVIVAAATGAFVGDNVAYLLGRRLGPAARRRWFRGEKAQRRLAWTDRQLATRGSELIAVGRFIPGGRTMVTLSAGSIGYPWKRFAIADAAAACGWASYAALVGYVGGRTFEREPWKGLVLAFGVAAVAAATVETVRWVRRRRRTRHGSS